MPECEMCGSENARCVVKIEGAKLLVCEKCARHGEVIAVERKERQIQKKVEKKKEEREIVVVPNFGDMIRRAREKMKIPRSVLAEMLNEKESYIERIEAEKTIPSEALARKMEKVLGIKLLEEVLVDRKGASEGKKEDLTLGDIVVLKKKGGGEG
ncbi:MAG: multiprotein bridging factor aMBF1 [Candidatus Micrarchaeia archaeon]